MEYNFECIGGKNNTYIIVTHSNVVYEIKFKPSQYLTQLNNLDENLIFEFVIEILDKPENVALTLDRFLAPTINRIFLDFYKSNNDLITVYICDSSDGKQFVRKRKFDYWFEQFNDSSFVKFDDVLKDKKGLQFPISFIIKKSNPNLHKIYNDFLNTLDDK